MLHKKPKCPKCRGQPKSYSLWKRATAAVQSWHVRRQYVPSDVEDCEEPKKYLLNEQAVKNTIVDSELNNSTTMVQDDFVSTSDQVYVNIDSNKDESRKMIPQLVQPMTTNGIAESDHLTSDHVTHPRDYTHPSLSLIIGK